LATNGASWLTDKVFLLSLSVVATEWEDALADQTEANGCGYLERSCVASTIQLRDCGAATLLIYKVDAQIGGKLAQLGQRLIGGTAKKLADQFFVSLSERIENNGRSTEVS
jgi:carbon monoxide dehydrogenase subunit G